MTADREHSVDVAAAADPPAAAPAPRHIVVIGDALRDLLPLRNESPDRLENLVMPQFPKPWKLSLILPEEIARDRGRFELPRDASHVVVCLEGSRAIEASGLLQGRPASFQDALVALSFAADEFERMLEQLIDVARSSRLPTVVCTMFPPRHDDTDHQRAVSTALMVFNQRIMRQAIGARVPIVTLALVCDDDDDYADATNLSKSGLRKAANVIAGALLAGNHGGTRSEVFF